MNGPPSPLQRLRTDAPAHLAPLYLRRHREPAGRAETLDLDTYFNAFDERVWRRHAAIGRLCVSLALSGGPATVRLQRRTGDGDQIVGEITSDEAGERTIELAVPDLPHPRAAGRLFVTIRPVDPDAAVTLRSGAWTGTAPPQPGTGVAVVICTCNRDVPLAGLLRTLSSDHQAAGALAAIVVVNNGPPGLAARLRLDELDPVIGDRLRLFEQGNVGGAGGFSRGLLEARSIPGVTHAILMDDDVALEPDAVFRAARFHQQAAGDVTLGGHMLDLFRPTILYEAGARIDAARFGLLPQHFQSPLAHAGQLDAFLEPRPVQYNGWWFMGLPLRLLDRHGWPMPCFIRGDDVEFGLRLHDAGVPSTAMLGVGIWHEPFTAKLGSWHLYYECRNMLAIAAWRLDAPASRMIRNVARWIAADLLTFRYQRAALLLRALEDFLEGPSVLDRDPRAIHASLASIRADIPVERAPPERVLDEPHPPRGPRTRPSFAVQLAVAALSEWFRPDRAGGRTIRIQPRDHLWFRLRGADAVAVAEPWEPEQPLYRRSRARYRRLARRAAALLLRARREMDAVRAAWRERLPLMTTQAAWTTYLQQHASMAHSMGEPTCHSTRPAQAAAIPHATSSAEPSLTAPATR